VTRYITTPIYYVNDRPHLGHLYTTLAADILCRFFRLSGHDVVMATGTDEHGAKVAQSAEQKGISPRQLTDDMSGHFKEVVALANVQDATFIRTTESRHAKAVHALWDKLVANGHVYDGAYEGWYAVRDEAFYDEKELTRTDDGWIAPSGASVAWVQEPCYFFRLSHFQQPLIDHYTAHPDAIAPASRYNEIMAFLRTGLKDLAVSRSKVTWGVPIPGSSHVFYVWIDALTNYLTVLGYPDSDTTVQTYWPHSIHLVGKDIVRFHAVYWPALLMAAGLRPPRRIFAHGWWLNDGQKMSKSIGNVIDPKDLIHQYGIDRVRYFLFRHVRFGQDGNFSNDLLVHRCNHELADGLGNLAHRILTFVHNRMDGVIPSFYANTLDSADSALGQWGRNTMAALTACMDQQDLYGYLDIVYGAIQRGNQFIDYHAPWALAKAARQGNEHSAHKMHSILYVLMGLVKDIIVFLWPFMPESCNTMWRQLGGEKPLDHNSLADLVNTPLVAGTPLPRPAPVFKKIDIPAEHCQN
jgi:methionyl-tRNA synthetase